MNFSILKPEDYFDEGSFIPNNKLQYFPDEAWNNDEEFGFDIYIDALQNLPDNTSLVKVLARVINHREKEIISWKEFWPQID